MPDKEHRCKKCNKLLLKGDHVFCPRCKIELKNKSIKIAGGVGISTISYALLSNQNDSDDFREGQ